MIPTWVNLHNSLGLGWSKFESTWGDPNSGQLWMISIMVNLCNPLGSWWPIGGGSDLGQFELIPFWLNLGWSQFGSILGYPNKDQLGMIPIWVNLGNPIGLGWPSSGDPNLGQLPVTYFASTLVTLSLSLSLWLISSIDLGSCWAKLLPSADYHPMVQLLHWSLYVPMKIVLHVAH